MSSRFIHGIACQNFLLFKAELHVYTITCIYHILFIHEWTSRMPDSLAIVYNAAIDSWVGKIPWRRAWQLTPVFLPGESYEQRSLAGYSPQVTKSRTQLKQVSTAQHTLEYKYLFVNLISIILDIYPQLYCCTI